MPTKYDPLGIIEASLGELKRRRKPPGWAIEVVDALYGPIIFPPEARGWEKTLPDWIRNAIPTERLIKLIKAAKGKDPEPGMATNIEALAYLYPATLTFPFTREWANIYSWLAAKELKKRGLLPKDIQVPKKLSPDEERKLRMFKTWLYDSYKRLRRKSYWASALVDEPDN